MGGRKRSVKDPEDILAEAEARARVRFAGQELDPIDPLVGLAIESVNPELTPAQRISVKTELAPYLYAKKKSVEVTGDHNTGPQIYLLNVGSPEQVEKAVKQGQVVSIEERQAQLEKSKAEGADG